MKRTNNFLGLITLLLLINGLSVSAFAKNEAKQLICEYKTNPLGIDIANPRLSWQLSASENNVMQSAYEIRVASSPEKLNFKPATVNCEPETSILSLLSSIK